ncbi:MAG: citryl-CoA lyase [Thalassovita sp.]
MTAQQDRIRSDICWSTPDQIHVHGLSLPDEILGQMNLGDMAFLLLMGRKPTDQESKVFNAVVITLVEHGVTPSALATRLTYAAAPEALQGAVAAGLCGLGSVLVGSMEGAARLLYEAVERLEAGETEAVIATDIVATAKAEGRHLPGFGHMIHRPVDPRTPRLFQIATENDMDGRYVSMIQAIHAAMEQDKGKRITLNATGALAALCCEFDLPWTVVRGIGVMARSIGLVGHILEETRQPLAFNACVDIERSATQHHFSPKHQTAEGSTS